MLTFVWPFIAVLLPIPFALFLMKKKATEPKVATALYVPFFKELKKECQTIQSHISFWSALFFFLSWIALCLSGMRPVFIGEPVSTQARQRQLMLVLDVSGSMEEDDFVLKNRRISRMNMVKLLSDDFLKKRKGDAVGLTLFGSEPYVYIPLTADVDTASQMLSELDVGMAGDQTAIGDALGLAVQTMKNIKNESKVIVFMSDGNANAGGLSPEQSLEMAKKDGIRVYTIGIGSLPYTVNTFFGRRQVNPASGLDEKTLRKIAEHTGGKYFRATTTADMHKIYDEIDKLEPIDTETNIIYPTKELYYYPLLLALILGFIGFYIREEV